MGDEEPTRRSADKKNGKIGAASPLSLSLSLSLSGGARFCAVDVSDVEEARITLYGRLPINLAA